MSFPLGLACFAIPGFISLVLFLRISEYRTDITRKQTPFEGKRSFGYANVFRRANYSDEGQRLYPWFMASVVATQVGGLVAVLFIR
jgi:hypothetical protein